MDPAIPSPTTATRTRTSLSGGPPLETGHRMFIWMDHVQAVDPLRRGELAPPPRTLVDIFRATVEQAADEPAVDAGNGVLTYAELAEAAGRARRPSSTRHGIGRGDKVGVRVSSGTTDLYVAILGILLAGAAYVPVDVDDPDERARLVFDEADVAAIVGNDQTVVHRAASGPRRAEPEEPGLGDDAWVIFTSGSTGTPKGVAVTHRSAAAFVDAESRMFLQSEPLGVGDRVMAGLSVAFDASCEEMWLAWRYGALPGPRAAGAGQERHRRRPLAGRQRRHRGVDGPDPGRAVADGVPGRRPAADHGRRGLPARARGPAGRRPAARCGTPTARPRRPSSPAARGSTGEGPVRIGLPLDGWDLAVVDAAGQPVAEGATGELIIGGVGLARYLDPAKDAEKYAAMPTLGWERAYRSGDLVVNDPAGLLFGGRADDQVKLGGRRIELGEIDSALLSVPGVVGAAAAVRRTAAGNQLLVGYVADRRRRSTRPRPWSCSGTRCRPRWSRGSRWSTCCPPAPPARSTATPCPGRCPRAAEPPEARGLHGTMAWLAELWLDVLGADVRTPADDFFDLGGGSLTAAQLVSRLRARFPEVVVGDIYEHPTVGTLAAYLDQLGVAGPASDREVPPTPLKTQAGQVVATMLLRALAGPYWLVWVGIGSRLLADGLGWTLLPRRRGGCWPSAGWSSSPRRAGCCSPRPAPGSCSARVEPGDHPRGGKVHLRLWLAQRVVDELGATGLAGAPYMTVVRAAARRRGRPRTSTCTASRRSPGCSGSAPAARSSPRSTSAATGSTATSCTSGRSGSARGPGSARAACSAPAPTSARTPRSRRARRCSGRCRTASTGPAPRPSGSRSGPAGRGRTGRRRAAAWTAAYGAVAVLLSCLPIAGGAGRRGRSRCCSADDPASYADLLGLLLWLPVSVLVGMAVLARADLGGGPHRRPGASGPACTRCAAAPRWRCGRRCGSSTTRAPGCSRSTPPASPRPGCGCSARGSARTSRRRPC